MADRVFFLLLPFLRGTQLVNYVPDANAQHTPRVVGISLLSCFLLSFLFRAQESEAKVRY